MLEKEHIIPFGIAGNALVLPKASCRQCAKITGRFEQECLRHLWWPFRTRIGAPSSSRERPETFRLRRVNRAPGGGHELIGVSDVSAKEYPLNYVALALLPPGILAGRPPSDNLEGAIWAAYSADEMRKYEGMLMGPITPNTFSRMLAKIAHAYAIACKGYGTFESLLLDLIFGKTETANYWVGGEMEIPPISEEPLLHEINLRRGTVKGQTYLIVTIQLFAFLPSPIYHVVVAKVDARARRSRSSNRASTQFK
jgi:hypothetical protein